MLPCLKIIKAICFFSLLLVVPAGACLELSDYKAKLHYVSLKPDFDSDLSELNKTGHVYISTQLSSQAVHKIFSQKAYSNLIASLVSKGFQDRVVFIARPEKSPVYSVDFCLEKEEKYKRKSGYPIPVTAFLIHSNRAVEVMPAPVLPSCSSLTSNSGQLYPWMPPKEKLTVDEPLEILVLELFKPKATGHDPDVFPNIAQGGELTTEHGYSHGPFDPFNQYPGGMPKREIILSLFPLWMQSFLASSVIGEGQKDQEEGVVVEFLSDNGITAYCGVSTEWLSQFKNEDILDFDFWRRLPEGIVRALSDAPIGQNELCRRQTSGAGLSQQRPSSGYTLSRSLAYDPQQWPETPGASKGIHLSGGRPESQRSDSSLNSSPQVPGINAQSQLTSGANNPEEGRNGVQKFSQTSNIPASILIHQTYSKTSYLSLPLPASSIVQTNGDHLLAEPEPMVSRLNLFNIKHAGYSHVRIKTEERSETGYYYKSTYGNPQTGRLPPMGALLLFDAKSRESLENNKITRLYVCVGARTEATPALFQLILNDYPLKEGYGDLRKLEPEERCSTDGHRAVAYRIELASTPVQLRLEDGYFITSATGIIDASGVFHSLIDAPSGEYSETPVLGDFAMLYDGSVIEENYPFRQSTDTPPHNNPPHVEIIPESFSDNLVNYQGANADGWFEHAVNWSRKEQNLPRLLLMAHGGLASGSLKLSIPDMDIRSEVLIREHKGNIRPKVIPATSGNRTLMRIATDISWHLSDKGMSARDIRVLLLNPDDSAIGKFISAWSYIAFETLFSTEGYSKSDWCRMFSNAEHFYDHGGLFFYQFCQLPSLGVARRSLALSLFEGQNLCHPEWEKKRCFDFVSDEVLNLFAALYFARMPIAEAWRYYQKSINCDDYKLFDSLVKSLAKNESESLKGLNLLLTVLNDSKSEKWVEVFLRKNEAFNSDNYNYKSLEIASSGNSLDHGAHFILDGGFEGRTLKESKIRVLFFVNCYLMNAFIMACPRHDLKFKCQDPSFFSIKPLIQGSKKKHAIKVPKIYDERFRLHGVSAQDIFQADKHDKSIEGLAVFTIAADSVVIVDPDDEQVVILPALWPQRVGQCHAGIGENVFRYLDESKCSTPVEVFDGRDSVPCFENINIKYKIPGCIITGSLPTIDAKKTTDAGSQKKGSDQQAGPSGTITPVESGEVLPSGRQTSEAACKVDTKELAPSQQETVDRNKKAVALPFGAMIFGDKDLYPVDFDVLFRQIDSVPPEKKRVGGNGVIYPVEHMFEDLVLKKTDYRLKEVNIAKTLRESYHPNVVSLLAAYFGEPHPVYKKRFYIYYLMPRADEDLARALSIKTVFNSVFARMASLGSSESSAFLKDRCRLLFLSILNGLEFMHYKGIGFRDLKMRNVLVKKARSCHCDSIFSKECSHFVDFSLCDFDAATTLNDDGANPHVPSGSFRRKPFLVGTEGYRPPEQILKHYTNDLDTWMHPDLGGGSTESDWKAFDIFSFAMLVCAVTTNKLLRQKKVFHCFIQGVLAEKIAVQKNKGAVWMNSPELVNAASNRWAALLHDLWHIPRRKNIDHTENRGVEPSCELGDINKANFWSLPSDAVDWSEQGYDLLLQTTQPDPAKRLSIDEIKKHPFLSDCE